MQHKNIFNLITKSILAGLLISLAGIVYLNCSSKIVGSFLFSLGLISVILLEANLFTGKIGYVNSKRSILDSLLILVFNLVAATIVGLIYRCGSDAAVSIAESKLLVFSESWWLTGLKSIGCGAAIYLAVEGYKKSKSLIPVILGVMVFILAGWNHCIADCFYMAAGSSSVLLAIPYLLVVIVGNSIGSLLIRFLQLGGKLTDELHSYK